MGLTDLENGFSERLAKVISNNFSGLIYSTPTYLDYEFPLWFDVRPIDFGKPGTVVFIGPKSQELFPKHLDPICDGLLLLNCDQERDYILREMNSRGYKLLNDHTRKIREVLKGDDCEYLERTIYLFDKC